MRKIISTFAILALGLILAACSAAATPEPTLPVLPSTPEPVTVSTGASLPTETVSDSQGAVIVEITPKNFTAETLDFNVSLNTHSVDLSMDLSTLATLTTDTGVTVPASLWDAPRGGHHVEGTLQFPASVAGKSVLEGAKQITIKIVNLDVPERVFTWDLP
ncbi:MAG: hypothetical protein ABIL11_18535 [Chloroflexota bacterium]